MNDPKTPSAEQSGCSSAAHGSARSSKRYRIVTDAYFGFEVQERPRWWPFWSQVGINTHGTIEAARKWTLEIEARSAEKKRKQALAGRVVEEVQVPNDQTQRTDTAGGAS